MSSDEQRLEQADAHPSCTGLTPRRPGSMRGQIHIPDDFDDPLPDWLLDAFEGIEPPSAE